VQWLNIAMAAEVLHVAILSAKQAVTQTKHRTLSQRRNYSVPTAGAADAVFS